VNGRSHAEARRRGGTETSGRKAISAIRRLWLASLGTGDRGQGTGDRGQGTGDRGQGTGDRGQGTACGVAGCPLFSHDNPTLSSCGPATPSRQRGPDLAGPKDLAGTCTVARARQRHPSRGGEALTRLARARHPLPQTAWERGIRRKAPGAPGLRGPARSGALRRLPNRTESPHAACFSRLPPFQRRDSFRRSPAARAGRGCAPGLALHAGARPTPGPGVRAGARGAPGPGLRTGARPTPGPGLCAGLVVRRGRGCARGSRCAGPGGRAGADVACRG